MSRTKRILTDDEKIAISKAKQELNEYRDSIKYIEEKLDDAEEVKCKVEKVTTVFSLTGGGSGSSPDKFGEAIGKLNDLEKDCAEKMQQMLLKKFDVDEKIEKVGQPYRNILFYRYTRGKEWGEVASKLGYTIRNCHILHGEALYFYSKI